MLETVKMLAEGYLIKQMMPYPTSECSVATETVVRGQGDGFLLVIVFEERTRLMMRNRSGYFPHFIVRHFKVWEVGNV